MFDCPDGERGPLGSVDDGSRNTRQPKKKVGTDTLVRLLGGGVLHPWPDDDAVQMTPERQHKELLHRWYIHIQTEILGRSLYQSSLFTDFDRVGVKVPAGRLLAIDGALRQDGLCLVARPKIICGYRIAFIAKTDDRSLDRWLVFLRAAFHVVRSVDKSAQAVGEIGDGIVRIRPASRFRINEILEGVGMSLVPMSLSDGHFRVMRNV